MLSLQRDLESLKLEQSKEQSLLGEILSLLGTIMTAHSTRAHLGLVQMIDNTVQTSPGLVAQFCAVSEEKHYYEGMKLCSEAFHYSEERVDQSICPVTKTSPGKFGRGASFQVRGTHPFERQRHISSEKSDAIGRQKSYHLPSVTICSPSPVATSIVTALVQDPRKKDSRKQDPRKQDPRKSATWVEVPREKKVPKRPQRCQTLRKKKRALILPQRRPNQGMSLNIVFENSQHDEDQENSMPESAVSAYQKTSKAVSWNHLPLQQQNSNRLMNTSICGHDQGSRCWSPSSNSSQMIVDYQQTEWETVKPEQKASTTQKQSVTWQLFDFISDSD